MLAHVATATLLAEVLGQESRVLAQVVEHLRQARIVGDRFPCECRRELTEQPRTSQAPAPHHDTVGPGDLDHAHCVARGPDIAIAQHRNAQRCEFGLQARDRQPVSLPAIHLRGRATVQSHPGHTFFCCRAAGIEIGEMRIVDTHAHLDRHRPAARGTHSTGHDAAKEVALPRQRAAAALARHLGHRAAEVEVNVIGEVLVGDHPHGPLHHHRVDAVELHGPRCLLRGELHHLEGLGVPFDQGSRGDHLGDVQTSGPVRRERRARATAQDAECPIGDSSHRCQNDRGVEWQDRGHPRILAPRTGPASRPR